MGAHISSHASWLPLLDLPGPWLRQLLATLEAQQLVAVSQTCRALQHEVLVGRDVTLTASLYEPEAEHRHISLQRAHQQAASVHLMLAGIPPAPAPPPPLPPGLQGERALLVRSMRKVISFLRGRLHKSSPRQTPPQPPAQPHQQHDPVRTAQAYLTNTVSALGHTLDQVSKVTLKGMTLTHLAPTWLTEACPHLTTLCLEDVDTSSLVDQLAATPPNSTITHLSMPAPPDPAALPDDAAQDAQLAVAQQRYSRHLQQLTALHKLTLTGPATELYRCIFRAPGQLAALTELSLPDMAVGDSRLQAMLQRLPALHTLTCFTFDLQDDYSEQPCSLRHIKMYRLRVDSIARLPLHSLQSITIAMRPCPVEALAMLGPVVFACTGVSGESHMCSGSLHPSTSVAANHRVVSAVQGMGGLRWEVSEAAPSNTVSTVDVGNISADLATAEHQAEALTALLDTFRPPTVTNMLLAPGCLSPAVAQLCSHVVQHTAHGLIPHLYWEEEEGAAMPADEQFWRSLLPALSHYMTVTLNLLRADPPVTEQELRQLLCGMPRPVMVRVIAHLSDTSKRWQRRMRAATRRTAVQLVPSVDTWLLLMPLAITWPQKHIYMKTTIPDSDAPRTQRPVALGRALCRGSWQRWAGLGVCAFLLLRRR